MTMQRRHYHCDVTQLRINRQNDRIDWMLNLHRSLRSLGKDKQISLVWDCRRILSTGFSTLQ